MKNIIISIGKLRLRIICVMIALFILFITIPPVLYAACGIIFLCCILNMQFVAVYSERTMLRLLYDKYNKYDVYTHILDGTWKVAYNSTYNDSLAFMLFDENGKLAKQIPQTKVLSFYQKVLLDNFPTLPHIEENVWVKGTHTSVSILRNKQQFSYKNT